MNRRVATCVSALSLMALHACGVPEEAPRVELLVAPDATAVTTVTNDLGYVVELTEARAAVENFAFAIAGEVHVAGLGQRLSDLLVPAAYAHPGHLQAGDVTGELRGRFVLDWLPESTTPLGTATLLVGAYESANFTFIRASAEDGLAPEDPLLGHTALLRGHATKDATSIGFLALLDAPEGRALIGAPFALEVREDSRERLGVRLTTVDPLEADTLFDGLDFAALDADDDGEVVIEESASEAAIVDAYNVLRRAFQTHDHFDVRPSLPE